MILQKYIAQSGYCSRRKAEELIKAGKVKINGQIAEAGMEFNDGDEVVICGKKIILKTEEKIYIILNKPRGYTCTKRKFEGEKNVFDLIKTDLFDVEGLEYCRPVG
jgi:23S rRNA pseudouridine2605 synthase